MIDFNKPVTTRKGRKVRILCIDASLDQPVVGLIENSNSVDTWYLNGKYDLDGFSSEINSLDLINPPPQKEVRYANIYPDEIIGGMHITREIADSQTCPLRIACIRIEFTPGQFDG